MKNSSRNYKQDLVKRYNRCRTLIALNEEYLENYREMMTEDAIEVMQHEIDHLRIELIAIQEEAKRNGVIL